MHTLFFSLVVTGCHFVGQAASVAPRACKTVLSCGAAVLVRVAVGGHSADANTKGGNDAGGGELDTDRDWHIRLHAAELLRFTLARIRLSAASAADRMLLDQMPSFIGALRACALSLAARIAQQLAAGEMAREHVDRVARLLRAIMATICAREG